MGREAVGAAVHEGTIRASSQSPAPLIRRSNVLDKLYQLTHPLHAAFINILTNG